jgi:hypothetical protein
MLGDFFINNLWASIGLWLFLCLTDSFLTVKGAKLYQKSVKTHFLSLGSYELEPSNQEDIDRFQPISFGFVLTLILYGGLLWIIYITGFIKLFTLLWGGSIFIEIAAHFRHLRNLLLFSYAARSEGIEGQVRYDRWLILRLSATDLFGHTILLMLVYLFTSNLIILGGVLGCLLMAVRHWLMSYKSPIKGKNPQGIGEI